MEAVELKPALVSNWSIAALPLNNGERKECSAPPSTNVKSRDSTRTSSLLNPSMSRVLGEIIIINNTSRHRYAIVHHLFLERDACVSPLF